MLRRILPVLAATLCLAPGLAVRADLAYFVSKTTGGLYTFDTSGGGITPLTPTNTFPNATALALGPDGNLYIGDSTGGGSIRRYTVAGGSVSTVVTLSGSNPAFGGGPVSPTALAFTPGGALLVGRNPESQFSGYPAGQVLEVVGWNGGTPTVQNYTFGAGLNYQTGLTVASNGTLFASNTLYDISVSPAVLIGNVVAFNGAGEYQSVVAADGTGLGGLSGPTGLGVFGGSLFIASAMDGKVYKTDLANSNTATNTSEFATTGGDYVGPLAVLSNGNLLVGSVSGFGPIYEFDTTGDLVTTFGSGGGYGQIGGIVAVPEPAAAILALAGAACAGLWRMRRRGGA
jgi:sugar lactone lactonase YvrE